MILLGLSGIFVVRHDVKAHLAPLALNVPVRVMSYDLTPATGATDWSIQAVSKALFTVLGLQYSKASLSAGRSELVENIPKDLASTGNRSENVSVPCIQVVCIVSSAGTLNRYESPRPG